MFSEFPAHEPPESFSLSGLRDDTPNPRGVVTGVVSRVEARSYSAIEGE